MEAAAGTACRKDSSILPKIWYTKSKIFKSGKVGGSDGRWNSPVPWKQGRSDLPEIRITRYTKDFSWDFYCTKSYQQAYRWADRRSADGIVNIYRPSVDTDGTLSIC